MALENGLYAQVNMIRRRESDDKKKKYKTNKYSFQGQSAITKHWFDLDHEWSKGNFIIRDPYFYKNYNKLNLGVIILKNIKKLEYQLVMQE